MAFYPTTEVNFSKIVKLSLRHYFKTFCYSLICIILLFLATRPNLLSFANLYSQLTVKYVFIIAIFFFFSVALLAAHLAFKGVENQGYKSAFKKICKRVLNIAGTIIVYAVGILIILYATHYMRIGILHVDVNASQTIKGLLIMLELVFLGVFLCMFFFSYPVSVIHEKSIPKSFLYAALLSEKNKIGIFLLLFIITLPYSLMRNHGMDFQFVAQHHLSFVYDFVVLSFFVPVFINLLLLFINDSKNQFAADDE